MRPLSVDFRRPAVVPRWAFIATGLVVLVALAVGGEAILQRSKLQQLQFARVERERLVAQPATQPKAVQRPPYEDSAWQMLALAKSPWPSMLTALETVESVGITVASIDVDPKERTVQIEIEFFDYARLLEYVDNLNSGEPAPRWRLIQSQASALPRASIIGPGVPSTATIRGSW